MAPGPALGQLLQGAHATVSVYYCIPSKGPAPESARCLRQWRDRGYRILIWREDDALGVEELRICDPYPGYSNAVNMLAHIALRDPTCNWVVTGGDDIYPDSAHTADEIAAQCTHHFSGTFGVMQPTGDRWGADDPYARVTWPDAPAMIDRICGSPWMGREFCERINQGHGPLWAEYFHNFEDEELQGVALKNGCLWQRRDLIHYHDHSRRAAGGQWKPHQSGYDADYRRTEPIFRARKAAGFPGSEAL